MARGDSFAAFLQGFDKRLYEKGGYDRLGSQLSRNIAGGKFYDKDTDPLYLQAYDKAMNLQTPEATNNLINQFGKFMNLPEGTLEDKTKQLFSPAQGTPLFTQQQMNETQLEALKEALNQDKTRGGFLEEQLWTGLDVDKGNLYKITEENKVLPGNLQSQSNLLKTKADSAGYQFDEYKDNRASRDAVNLLDYNYKNQQLNRGDIGLQTDQFKLNELTDPTSMYNQQQKVNLNQSNINTQIMQENLNEIKQMGPLNYKQKLLDYEQQGTLNEQQKEILKQLKLINPIDLANAKTEAELNTLQLEIQNAIKNSQIDKYRIETETAGFNRDYAKQTLADRVALIGEQLEGADLSNDLNLQKYNQNEKMYPLQAEYQGFANRNLDQQYNQNAQKFSREIMGLDKDLLYRDWQNRMAEQEYGQNESMNPLRIDQLNLNNNLGQLNYDQAIAAMNAPQQYQIPDNWYPAGKDRITYSGKNIFIDDKGYYRYDNGNYLITEGNQLIRIDEKTGKATQVNASQLGFVEPTVDLISGAQPAGDIYRKDSTSSPVVGGIAGKAWNALTTPTEGTFVKAATDIYNQFVAGSEPASKTLLLTIISKMMEPKPG
jgi:hypothetical protein